MKSMSEQMKKIMDERQLQPHYKALINEVLKDEEVQTFLTINKDKLNDDVISKSAAKLYEFVQEKSKFQNNEVGLAPGFYPELVINKNYIDVSYVPSQEKIQELKNQAERKRIKSFYMPKNIRNVRLQDIEETRDRLALLEAVYAFVEAYINQAEDFHRGIYVHGPFGVGKTYILAAMANELAKYGYESTLVHFPSLSQEMKRSIADNTTGEKIDIFKETPILILDDIGADSMSSWLRDEVLGVILQYRMQEELATFFTSNLSMQALEEHLTTSQRGEHEPLKAKRLMERVRFLAQEMELDGSNRRLT